MNIRSVQRFFVHHRVRASFFIFIVLIAEWLTHVSPRPMDIESGSGVLLVVAGALLRSWAAGIIQKNALLGTKGPYALARHPLYLGSFMTMIGFALVIEDKLALAAVAAVILLVYIPTIRNEERVLAQRFGEQWQAYARQTGMLFPKRLPQLTARWEWARWRHHREYRALGLTLLALALFEFWNLTAAG